MMDPIRVFQDTHTHTHTHTHTLAKKDGDIMEVEPHKHINIICSKKSYIE